MQLGVRVLIVRPVHGSQKKEDNNYAILADIE